MQLRNSLLKGAAVSLLTAICAMTASADCPTSSSVERYVESSRDALVALNGALPTDQYLDLENRYAAMIVMEWSYLGISAIQDDDDALSKLTTCFRDQLCGADGSDAIDQQLSDVAQSSDLDPSTFWETLTDAPSDSMLEWAEIELGCREAPAPEELQAESDLSPASEIDSEAIVEVELADDGENTEILASISETDTDPSGELVAEAAQPPLPIPPLSEDPLELVQMATAFIAAGEIERAIPPLRDSCLYDIAQTQTSIACDTLLDIYEARTQYGDEEIATSSYLSFSEEICSVGYITGCENMALYLRAANTDGAYERGVEFTARSCELGDAGACATLAQDHIEGRTEQPDLAFARATLERSCELGRLQSCREVADLYVRGVGGEADSARALDAVALACPAIGARSPDLCVSAADFVLINMKSSEQRAAQVRGFIKRACDIGHGVGCAWYAEDLELGIGGRADPEAAREARITACEYGDQESCRTRS